MDWSLCPDVERIAGKVSGAWIVKGTRVQAADRLNVACKKRGLTKRRVQPDPLSVIKQGRLSLGTPRWNEFDHLQNLVLRTTFVARKVDGRGDF